jgi:Na+-driven multidrug efflux pump
MKIMFTLYFLCGFMDVAGGVLRGFGYSITSTIICLSGACFFRIFWVTVIFPQYKTMESLLWSYPFSWSLVALVSTIALSIIYRKILRTQCPRFVEWKKWNPFHPRGCRHTMSMK